MGDKGAALEGLRTIYYDPEAFKILPYRHKYSEGGSEVITGFFIPYFAQSLNPEYMDHRGVCDHKRFIDEVLQPERDRLARMPDKYVKKCAERCWTAEEAFNLEGDNKFNKAHITELLTRIRALKQCPPIERGTIKYRYRNNKHTPENIDGFIWEESQTGPVKILERPIWELPEKKDDEGKVIWSPPTEKIRNLYVVGIDGIDIGASQTSDLTKDPSDFCLVVYKRAYGLEEPKVVALYKDRPQDIRTAYKIAVTLTQYYNGIINIEATRLSIIPWASERKLLKLFMKRPTETLSEKAKLKGGKRYYGTPATPAIISHQTDLIADYVEDYCHLIWFEEMLVELNLYNDENKRKFDIVASFAMALLADEELQGTVPKTVEVVTKGNCNIGYYIDENGHKRWGLIPESKEPEIRFNNNFGLYVNDTERIRTSNTRILERYI